MVAVASMTFMSLPVTSVMVEAESSNCPATLATEETSSFIYAIASLRVASVAITLALSTFPTSPSALMFVTWSLTEVLA